MDRVSIIPGQHELHDTWVLYGHNKDRSKTYDENLLTIAEGINTVVEFWQYMNHLPKPSQHFFNSCFKTIGGNPIHSWSLFRRGIEPTWEYPDNHEGGEFNIRKLELCHNIDFIWETLLLWVIGEDFDHSLDITGVRIVDSSNYNKKMYRIEIWYNKNMLEGHRVLELENSLKYILGIQEPVVFLSKLHKG